MNIVIKSKIEEFKILGLTSLELSANEEKLKEELLTIILRLEKDSIYKKITQLQEVTPDFINHQFTSLQRFFVYALFGFSDCQNHELIFYRIIANMELNRLKNFVKIETDNVLKNYFKKSIFILEKGLDILI